MNVSVSYPELSTLTSHQLFFLLMNFRPSLLLEALCPRAGPSLYRISPAYAHTYSHENLVIYEVFKSCIWSRKNASLREEALLRYPGAAGMLHLTTAITYSWISQYRLQDLLWIGNCIILREFGYFSLVDLGVGTHKKEPSIYSWGKGRRVSWK